MTIQRMDNVLIVVDDLEAAKAFFTELGMELEGEAPVEGRWVDRVVGLNDVRADIASVRIAAPVQLAAEASGQLGRASASSRRRAARVASGGHPRARSARRQLDPGCGPPRVPAPSFGGRQTLFLGRSPAGPRKTTNQPDAARAGGAGDL